MKNLMPLGIFLLLFSFTLNAQNSTYQHTVSVNAGASFVGAFVNLLDGNNLNDANTTTNIEGISNLNGRYIGSTTPALQVSYDYGVNDRFSIGGSVAFQQLDSDLTNLTYTRESDNQSINIEAASVDINRVNIAARALLHYGNGDRIDIYSGIRIGLTHWGTKVESDNAIFEEDLNDSNLPSILPSVQLIPFALRGYVTENIGLNFELGIGTPHFFALGVNYRL